MAEPLPLPRGFGIELDPATKQLNETTLFGGSPARILRLSAAGCTALAELRAGPVASVPAGVLARRLTDAGLAHPRPPAPAGDAMGLASGPGHADVSVIIPVKDMTELLAGCLAAVGCRYPVVVVDDGSADPAAVAAVAAQYGAKLHRCTENGGPAAARNVGLAGVTTPLVAFLDSDCEAPGDWIELLAAHFADPLVGAVAPRIVTAEAANTAGRYAAACSSLDLGSQQARVAPLSRVSYLPTAALLVRRTALDTVTGPAGTFDPALRFGEDVDLIWRLHAAGWRIRYQPAVLVLHAPPAGWSAVLGKRFRYGTSAGPLAQRHPQNLAPLVLQPWPAVTVAALLARRPALAAAGLAAGWADIAGTVRRAGVSADGAFTACLTSAWQTWRGVGRYTTQFAAPALAAAVIAPGGKTLPRRWGRRAAAASLLLGPAVIAWRERKPGLDPARFVAAQIADDVCYGAGVWAGCLRERTAVPLTPRVSWRPLRIVGAGIRGVRRSSPGPAEVRGSSCGDSA